MAGQIWISPTILNMGADCPRCLVDTVLHKFKRPKGIFPSLPGGVDGHMKTYCDAYRGKLPPVVVDMVKGTELEGFVLHPDQRWVSNLREWNKGILVSLKVNGVSFRLSCSFDDMLLREDDDALGIIDYKSKARPPEPGEGARYYLSQMDAYALALKTAGFRIVTDCLLWYVSPTSFDGDSMQGACLRMDQAGQILKVDPDRAYKQIEALADLINKYPDRNVPPPSMLACEYCNFAERENA